MITPRTIIRGKSIIVRDSVRVYLTAIGEVPLLTADQETALVTRLMALRKTRFSTYATWWIAQAIRRALVDQPWIIRVPENAVRKARRDPTAKPQPSRGRSGRHGGSTSKSR